MNCSTNRRHFLAAATGTALAASTGLAQAQSPAHLRVGSAPNESFAEAFYAQDMGFFTKAGLTVDLTTMSLGPQLVPAVAAGTLDIAISSLLSLANASIHGLPFVYLASGGLYLSTAPTIVLCVAKDAAVQSPKEFEGKAVSVATLNDITHLALVAYLAQNAVDVTKVNVIELGFAEVGPALQRGTIVAGIVSEPALTAALSADRVRVFAKPFDAIGTQFMIGGWFARADWYQQNKALAKRFAAVIYETAAWANHDRVDSGRILQKYTKVSPATTDKMTRVTYGESLGPALIASTLTLAYKYKMISRPVAPGDLIAT